MAIAVVLVFGMDNMIALGTFCLSITPSTHGCFTRILPLGQSDTSPKKFSKGKMPRATFIATGTHRNAINPRHLAFVNFATCPTQEESRGTKKALEKSLVNFRYSEVMLC